MSHFIIKLNKVPLRLIDKQDCLVYGWDIPGDVVEFSTENEAQQWITAHQVFCQDAQIVPVSLDPGA